MQHIQCFYDDLRRLSSKTEAYRLSRYIFVIGAHYSNDKNGYLTSHLRLAAKQIILHSEYQPNTKLNDIALIELMEPIDLDDKTIGFICLPMAALKHPKYYPPDRADTVEFE